MDAESEIIDLCAEACANIRAGYTQSACLIIDEALSLWRERRFNKIVDNIAPLLKGETHELA